MKHTMNVSGVFGEWSLTVELQPGDRDGAYLRIDDAGQRAALTRFKSLEHHFFDLVSLAEMRQLEQR